LFFRKKKVQTNNQSNQSSETERPGVVVFIDFDHWEVSLNSLYRIEADVRIILDSLKEKREVKEIYVFGDFNGQEKKLADLALLTEDIYDVQGNKKSDKDFIMLDKLYRCGAKYKDTETAVAIVSGSGHFTLAARFLREACSLSVGIYGVRGATSNSLREAASWSHELPNEEYISMLFPIIIRNCVIVSERDINATFKTTVEVVSSYYKILPTLIEDAVAKMLELGYLYQKQRTLSSFESIKVLRANWEKLIKDGLYDPEGM